MSNIEAYQAAPQSYVQLLLFDSTRKIHWRSASNTNEISDALLGDCMHKFFASLSISSALFDGISLPVAKKKDKDHHHVYLNRRHISLPHRNRALVVGTRSDHILTGYPLSERDDNNNNNINNNDLWLGIFTRGFSVVNNNEDYCVLLEKLAFASEILPPLHLDSVVARFEYLSTTLLSCRDDNNGDDNIHMHMHDCLKSLLRAFSSDVNTKGTTTTTNNKFITYPPSSLSLSLSPRSNIPPYDASMLQSLRPEKYPVRSPWWVVAACILTKDGVVLKTEGVTRAISSILCWRYACFSSADKRLTCNVKSGLQEYRNGILLRAWYSMGPLCLCILTSQAVSTQTTSVSSEDLANLAARAFILLENVKTHYAA